MLVNDADTIMVDEHSYVKEVDDHANPNVNQNDSPTDESLIKRPSRARQPPRRYSPI